MHYFIYSAYYKHFKKDLFNSIRAMPKVMKISNFAWFAIVSVSFIAMFAFSTKISCAIFVITFTISTLMFCGVDMIYNRRTLDTRIEERKSRLQELDIWLKNMGVKEKNDIKQLRNKLQRDINEKQKSIDKVETIIFKIFELICVPVILAFFSYILQLADFEITEKVTVCAVVLVYSILVVVSVLFFVYTVITEIIKNQQHNYKMFADDLQDVLDTQYEIKNEDILE